MGVVAGLPSVLTRLNPSCFSVAAFWPDAWCICCSENQLYFFGPQESDGLRKKLLSLIAQALSFWGAKRISMEVGQGDIQGLLLSQQIGEPSLSIALRSLV